MQWGSKMDNDNLVLLVEQWGMSNNIKDGKKTVHKPLVESVIDDEALYIEGIFLQAEVVNGNKRFYPKRVLEEAVDLYKEQVLSAGQGLGELNHPERSSPDPLTSCIVLEDLWWEGNNVLGRARVVVGDYAEGDKVAALIKAGWIPTVSSRGLGKVTKRNGINYVDKFYLTVGVDIVYSPSAPDAYVHAYKGNKKPIIAENIGLINTNRKDDSEKINTLIKRLNQNSI